MGEERTSLPAGDNQPIEAAAENTVGKIDQLFINAAKATGLDEAFSAYIDSLSKNESTQRDGSERDFDQRIASVRSKLETFDVGKFQHDLMGVMEDSSGTIKAGAFICSAYLQYLKNENDYAIEIIRDAKAMLEHEPNTGNITHLLDELEGELSLVRR